jgi:hypothetical protein
VICTTARLRVSKFKFKTSLSLPFVQASRLPGNRQTTIAKSNTRHQYLTVCGAARICCRLSSQSPRHPSTTFLSDPNFKHVSSPPCETSRAESRRRHNSFRHSSLQEVFRAHENLVSRLRSLIPYCGISPASLCCAAATDLCSVQLARDPCWLFTSCGFESHKELP